MAASALPHDFHGSLASISVADDGARLARHATGISEVIKEIIFVDIDEDDLESNSVLLGGHLPGSKNDLIALLTEMRSNWPPPDDERARAHETLALVIGRLFHQALSVQLQPLYESYGEAERMEARIYQDAAIMHARSSGTEGRAQTEEVASLLAEMVPRALIRYHTLIPDYDDPEGWIMRLIEWRERHADLTRRYAEAYTDPDPSKVSRFVTAPNFYSADDPIIRHVHDLRDESAADASDIGVLAESPGESLYAQAVGQGFRHVEAVDAYFAQTIDASTLRGRLDSF